MTKLKQKLQVLDELAKRISATDILNKDDVVAMDKKVSTVLSEIRTNDKRYFKRLS